MINETTLRLLEESIDSIKDSIIAFRKELHQWPEGGFREFKTAELIESFLLNLPGLNIQRGVGGSGLVAVLNADKSGPCIAFRADMDGLPIAEASDVDYCSKNPGWMHACGHDGHCAIQAGLAMVLASMQEYLHGPVKFIFQPAEEGLGGAREMIKEGALKNPTVNAVFGLHGWPDLNLGSVGSRKGPFFASTDNIYLNIKGRGGHAAMPNLAVDPILIAAQIITSAQSLISRRVSPFESAVISFCKINAGTANNVIPNEVKVSGTVRFLDSDRRTETLEQLRVLCEQTASAMGGEASLDLAPGGYPVLECHEALCNHFLNEADSVLGSDKVSIVNPTMGGEDFAYYAMEIPACFWLLGLRGRGKDSQEHLHSPKFDFNDDAIEIGIRLQAQMALKGIPENI